jgi:hypothetical protein
MPVPQELWEMFNVLTMFGELTIVKEQAQPQLSNKVFSNGKEFNSSQKA